MGLIALNPRKTWVKIVCLLLLAIMVTGTIAVTPANVAAQEKKANAKTNDEKSGSGLGFFTLLERILVILGSLFRFDSWPFGVLFALLQFCLTILLLILFFDLFLGSAIPLGFVEEFSNIVNRRQFKQAFDLCRADGSFLSRVLTAGMGRLQYGIEDARHAAGNMCESIRRGKDQLINYVATIATVGPLVGLSGTVWGMIGAFSNISQSTGEPQPQVIAGDISVSLGTTWIGIAIALVALFFNTFFRNRLMRITLDTSNLADDLLTQMYHNSRKPGGAPAGQQPAPAAAVQAGRPPAAGPNTPPGE